MNKYFLLKKINLFLLGLSFAFSFNNYSMEEGSDYSPKLCLNNLKLLKTNRIESIDRYSAEFEAFMKGKEISIERKNQQEEHPDLDIDTSNIRAKIISIDLKINELKRYESLLHPEEKEKVKKKKHHKIKKPTFKSVARQAKKVKQTEEKNIEQKLEIIRKILAKEATQDLSAKNRNKLCMLLPQISDSDVDDYINLIDKQIAEIKKQINWNELKTSENIALLQLIKDGNLSPRNSESSKSSIPRKLSRAHTIGSLPIKEK